jgi:hypothetical protein
MGSHISSHQKIGSYVVTPRRVASKMRNSYTLETLDGDPIDGVFNARQLPGFEPRDGTRLAFNELVRENRPDDEEDSGV